VYRHLSSGADQRALPGRSPRRSSDRASCGARPLELYRLRSHQLRGWTAQRPGQGLPGYDLARASGPFQFPGLREISTNRAERQAD